MSIVHGDLYNIFSEEMNLHYIRISQSVEKYVSAVHLGARFVTKVPGTLDSVRNVNVLFENAIRHCPVGESYLTKTNLTVFGASNLAQE